MASCNNTYQYKYSKDTPVAQHFLNPFHVRIYHCFGRVQTRQQIPEDCNEDIGKYGPELEKVS
mgnify:CR=1 FL=1